MLRRRRSSAFSLIEVLIVVSLMGILAATLIPNMNPTMREQLYSASDILAADMAWCRSLAVTNNSTYRLTFSLNAKTYTITHSGARTSLNTLPPYPFAPHGSSGTSYVINLQSLSSVAIPIDLVAVRTLSSTPADVTVLEFNGLGATSSANDTAVWIAAGTGGERRYLSVRVDHATGLTWTENFQATAPPAAVSAGVGALEGS